MKSIMLAGVAMLSFTGVAMAQDMAPGAPNQPPGAEAPPMPDNVPPKPAADPAADGKAAAEASKMTTGAGADIDPAMAADPNAGVPTGAVPANPGMKPASPYAPRDPAAPLGTSANPVQVGGNVMPAPTDAKDYPLCSKAVQDSCINPGEAKAMKRR